MSLPDPKENLPDIMDLDLSLPYKVADITLAELGLKEMALAEKENPKFEARNPKL
ncbi:MAG: adenosylhomocysteinase [Desulfobacterales bacterium]|nr:adenosylhomocysteinase [Desulfobacterales bacterium]